MKTLRDALAGASEELPIQAMLPGLRDAHHRLEALLEKVSQQHAYALIFGPLKSGKSTLMNALSGAYVSEVTSLPGYPCLTRVRHEEERSLTVQRYDGQSERFRDLGAMRLHVARAHAELAERIRQAERAGEDFDPEVHLRDAIRTIDVGMPADGLKRSGAVLVDTPGLYSRMKFHYDRMTRDYRDIAACAIFVVKSDNLFLEQVFEEFDQLLRLFHRVFLVVNLDTSKMDLAQEGGLVPSLEQRDPARVIEAFENLSMSAGMREAARTGRLKTYAIDLLGAASERLKHADRSEDVDTASAAFDGFLADLTDYLDGSEFLHNFLTDSVRRAETVVEDVRTLVANPSVGALRRRLDELKARRVVLEGKKRSLERLRGQNWEESFENLREKLGSLSRHRIQAMLARDQEKVAAIIDGWIGSDLALGELVDDELKPLFASSRQELTRLVSDALVDEVARPSAGAQVPTGVLEDLRTSGIQLGDIASATAEGLENKLQMPRVPAPLALADLPIRRSFWEVLLFRSRELVRQRVFGAPSAPTRPVPRVVKAKRFAPDANAELTRVVAENYETFVQKAVQTLKLDLVRRYVQELCRELESRLASEAATIQAELSGVERQFGEGRSVLSELEILDSASQRVAVELTPLEERFARNVDELEREPAVTLMPASAPSHEGVEDADEADSKEQVVPEAPSVRPSSAER
ncbi:MAG: dynamin family protein [Planctomycetota bacterium]